MIPVCTYTFTSDFVFTNYTKMERVDNLPRLKNKIVYRLETFSFEIYIQKILQPVKQYTKIQKCTEN